MTSLGPWSPEDTVAYLGYEHLGLDPSAAEQVATLLASTDPIIELKFGLSA